MTSIKWTIKFKDTPDEIDREIMRLHDQGCTNEEIGEQLGLHLGSVTQRKWKLRRRGIMGY